jgi:hypothetical protein
MMTTWSAMLMLRLLRMWGLLWCVAALSACGSLRLAYDTGPTLAWWWIDGYADFSGDQAARVKDDIRAWFAWHRKAQLPAYADWLAATRRSIGDSITPAQACRAYDEGRALLDPALDRALLGAAAWVHTLTEPQLRHMEQHYAKKDAQLRDDFAPPDAAARRRALFKRTLERAELFYGRLDDAQRQWLDDELKTSPFDPEAWLRERQRWQEDAMQTLRRLRAERADADRVVAALRTLAERHESSPDPAYRAYRQRLQAYDCALAARLHAAVTPQQRRHLAQRLAGWEDDARALAAAAP